MQPALFPNVLPWPHLAALAGLLTHIAHPFARPAQVSTIARLELQHTAHTSSYTGSPSRLSSLQKHHHLHSSLDVLLPYAGSTYHAHASPYQFLHAHNSQQHLIHHATPACFPCNCCQVPHKSQHGSSLLQLGPMPTSLAAFTISSAPATSHLYALAWQLACDAPVHLPAICASPQESSHLLQHRAFCPSSLHACNASQLL